MAQLFNQRHHFFQPLDPDFLSVTSLSSGFKTILAVLVFPSHIRVIKREGTQLGALW